MTTISLFCGGDTGGGRISGRESLVVARGGEMRSLVSEKDSGKGWRDSWGERMMLLQEEGSTTKEVGEETHHVDGGGHHTLRFWGNFLEWKESLFLDFLKEGSTS